MKLCRISDDHHLGCTRYGESFPVSAEAIDSSFCLPIGKAKVCFSSVVKSVRHSFCFSSCSYYVLYSQIEREGEHVTITAFSKMVGYALQVRVLVLFFAVSFYFYPTLNINNYLVFFHNCARLILVAAWLEFSLSAVNCKFLEYL